ncbi:MAG: hypothetical protein WBV94_12400 [Blastocatellia bacterium]
MFNLKIKVTAVMMFAAFALACGAPAPTVVPPGSAPTAQPGSAPAQRPVPPQQGGGAGASGDLKLQAPDGWISEPPTSSMRVAQYKLPGDGGDASLIVFYFGPGQGGSVDANLERWIGQMQQPDGSSSRAKAKTETTTVNGMPLTLLDVTGTYSAGDMTGGGGSGQAISNARMRAAVIETSKGAYYIKLVGPEKTVERWDAGYMAFVKSAQLK